LYVKHVETYILFQRQYRVSEDELFERAAKIRFLLRVNVNYILPTPNKKKLTSNFLRWSRKPISFNCFHISCQAYCWCSILRGLVPVPVPRCYASHFLAGCWGHSHSTYSTAKLFWKFVLIHPGSERRSWSSSFNSTAMRITYPPQLLYSLLCEVSKQWVLVVSGLNQ
jgi:hypothetical protein